MATGDIISCEVDSTGSFAYITVDGWAASLGNITYDYGDVTNGAGTVAFTVVSEGYDGTGTLGTVTRTLYGYDTVRKAKPDDASLDEVVVGSDLKIRVALSSDVYDDDNTGAGKSGTAPTVTISAAWATSSSPSRTSNAVSALTVTNSSTLDYPTVFGQHDPYAGTLMRSRVKSDFPVAFAARHGEGIACVRWNATGGTSGHTEEAFATVQTTTQRTASGLYACAYGATIPLSGFTQGEAITVRVRAYPVVGDAASVQDTNGRTTASNEVLGWNDLILTCDKDNLLDVIRYVSTTGSDSADGSFATPWLTIGKATTTAGVNIVRLLGNNTTHNLGSTASRRTATEWVIVEPDTGVTGCRVQMTTTRTYRCERLMLRDVELRLATTGSWLDGENLNFLALDNVTFNKNGIGNPTAPFCYASLGCYVLDCSGDLAITKWRLQAFSTDRVLTMWDGCSFETDNATAADITGWYRVVACELNGNTFALKGSTALGPQQDGGLFEFNTNLNATSSARNLLLLRGISIVGLSVLGNLFEKTAGSESAVHLWADNTSAASTHILVAHNTFVGSGSGRRCNLFYNDRGTTAYAHKSVFLRGNHIDEGNIKSDAFGLVLVSITRSGSTATATLNAVDASNAYAVGQSVYISGATQPEYNGTFTVASSSGASSGGTITFTVSGTPATPATGTITIFGLGRIGNWPQLYGSKWRSNNIDTQSSGSFDWEALGVDGTRATPSWVDSASDDYTPSPGDPLIGRVGQPFVPYDLYGRRFAGSACIGAVQIVTANVTPFIGGSMVGIIG